MKKIIAIALAQLFLASSAFAVSYTFSDQDFLSGASWGTMDITAQTSTSLKIQYTAEPDSVIPSGSQVTGFGFSFSSGVLDPPIGNPAAGDYGNDRDDLDWILYDKDINTLPGIANGDEFTPEVTQADYMFAVTEGNDQTFNPPGILPGETDIFFLSFSGLGSLNLLEAVLGDFVYLTGIRLQSLPNDINGGSLFLAGDGGGGGGGNGVIPEPSTFVLLGAGIAGLAFYRRRKN